MMPNYVISIVDGPYSKEMVATVESLGEANIFLYNFGHVVSFEEDPDGWDAADAAVVNKQGNLDIYVVEPINGNARRIG